MKKCSVLLAVFLACILCVTSVYGEDVFGVDGLETDYGFYFRLRQETWDNTFDFDDETGLDDAELFRFKTSIWMKNDYEKKFGLMAKLTNEARYYNEHIRNDEGFYEDEIFFDNLYVWGNDLFGLPLDVYVGRLDFLMTFGEGFLIMDGTPEDGSRSYYFNAVRLNYEINKNHNFDLVYIDNPRKDRFLPSMYPDHKQLLNTSDEMGFVFYSRNRLSDMIYVEPYYMYKEEDDPAMANGRTERDLELHTIGTRAIFTLGDYKLRGEYAYQFGEYDSGNDREAWGGYIFLSRQYKNITWQPKWEIGAVFLTGDKAGTSDTDEGFNPLFSKWPMLSEAFVFVMATERGATYWTNMEWYRIGLNLTFTEQTNLDLKYNFIMADEAITGNPFSSGTGDERGHMTMAKATHKFTKKIKGYLMVEHMIPLDHYASDDRAMFVRWELEFKF